MTVHIVKLCVGCDTIEELADWQRKRLDQGQDLVHVTRQTPRREGVGTQSSLYWVIGGFIRARRCIVGLREVRGADGIPRCGFELDPGLVATEPVPRRPFQGWRYLPESDAPRDLDPNAPKLDGGIPASMRAELAELRLI